MPRPQSLSELDLDPLTLTLRETRIPGPGGRSGGSPPRPGMGLRWPRRRVGGRLALWLEEPPVRSPSLALPLSFLLLPESETGGTKVKPKLLLPAQPRDGRGTGAAAGRPTWQAQDGGRSRSFNCGDFKKRKNSDQKCSSVLPSPPPPPPRSGLLCSPSLAGLGAQGQDWPGPFGIPQAKPTPGDHL